MECQDLTGRFLSKRGPGTQLGGPGSWGFKLRYNELSMVAQACLEENMGYKAGWKPAQGTGFRRLIDPSTKRTLCVLSLGLPVCRFERIRHVSQAGLKLLGIYS